MELCDHGRDPAKCELPSRGPGEKSCRKPKPRKIRGVTAYYRAATYEGRAKTARDKKSRYQIEQVHAQISRACTAGRCHQLIEAGEFFARVWDGKTVEYIRPGIRRTIPVTGDYHFACVPEGAKYLVRFFKP